MQSVDTKTDFTYCFSVRPMRKNDIHAVTEIKFGQWSVSNQLFEFTATIVQSTRFAVL